MLKQPRGQAMIEFLPLMGIFIVVMSASLAFFRSLREGVLRQEALRNIYFASVRNMGTMTSPPESRQSSGNIIVDLEGNRLIQKAEPIGPNTPCYFITPGEIQTDVPIKGIYMLEDKITAAIQYRHFGIVRRLPGPPCKF